MTSKWRHTLKFLMNLNSWPKNSPMCQIWTWSSNYLENNSSFFVFSIQKMTLHNGNKRLLWQHLTAIVIDKICKMSVKGVSQTQKVSFQYLLEFWSYGGKTLGGRIPPPPPGPDRVKPKKRQLLFVQNTNKKENEKNLINSIIDCHIIVECCTGVAQYNTIQHPPGKILSTSWIITQRSRFLL